MIDKRNVLLYVSVILIFSACAAMLPQVSPQQVNWAARQWPGMDSAKLDEARALYVSRCSGCHSLELPKKHSVEEWERILNVMAPKAKLNGTEKEQIRRYILTARS